MITVVGLGSGPLHRLTLEAVGILEAADRVHVRKAAHPAVTELTAHYPTLDIVECEHADLEHEDPEVVAGRIVGELLALAESQPVIYCVPGSPSMGEPTVELLRSLTAARGLQLRIVPGISSVEAALSVLEIDSTSWLTVLDAAEVHRLAHENALGEIQGRSGTSPMRTPNCTAPLVIINLSKSSPASAQNWLLRWWPPDHEVVLLAHTAAGEEVKHLILGDLASRDLSGPHTLFVPPLQPAQDLREFTALLNVTRTLRAPGGCPWDREQTHDSLKPHLTEETYEAVEALDRREPARVAEELGDLLFQITIHAQIAAERGEFDISDVIAGVTSKLIRRHPHVFGSLELPTATAVLQRWEIFKEAEKPGRESILSSIPTAMPALPYSYAIQRRAANQGFEWPDVQALLSKAQEELEELRAELGEDSVHEQVVQELGDLLFVLVSLGRRLRVDPEEALRKANHKFVSRFQHVELRTRALGKRLTDLSPRELDLLWDEAKQAVAI